MNNKCYNILQLSKKKLGTETLGIFKALIEYCNIFSGIYSWSACWC